jgi:hypothetical protein
MPAPALPPAILGHHVENNRATADSWDIFADHRERVTRLVVDAAPGGRLLVLGAGNCNDLDLAALATHFREVHLADVDERALRRARERVPPEVAAALTLHAPVDLSGALHRLPDFRRTPPTPAQLGALPRSAADAVLATLPGGFDVVLSACLLSQLMHSCYLALGARHQSLQLAASALAIAHLRSLAGLLAPQGTAVLVTDTVSSETYALADLWPGRDPLQVLGEVDRQGYALTGTGPSSVRRIITQDAVVAPLASPPRLVPPWLWRFSDEITYLVYALVFRRIS